MQYQEIENSLHSNNISFTQNQTLQNKNTFKISAAADLFIAPKTIEELALSLSIAANSNLPYFVLGGGSNIVFPEHYNGIIISTEALNQISVEPFPSDTTKVLVTCSAGTPTATFVNFCTKNNISGAEQFAGLPGSLGGACFMNARCFNKSISDILYSTEHIELDSKGTTQIITLPFDSTKWDYKLSPFQTQKPDLKIVTSATFLLEQKSESQHQEIEADCKKYISERVDKGHFKYPSAGSVFKNNHDFGAPSGKLIDQAGLRGTQIGGAKIADFHGNFIINVNNATQKDIKDLVELTQKTVKEKFGFLLEPEIIFVDK